jgi:hypothetical protein
MHIESKVTYHHHHDYFNTHFHILLLRQERTQHSKKTSQSVSRSIGQSVTRSLDPVGRVDEFGAADGVEHGRVAAHVLERLADAAGGGGQRVRGEEGLDLRSPLRRAEAADGAHHHGRHQGGRGLGVHCLDQLEVLEGYIER